MEMSELNCNGNHHCEVHHKDSAMTDEETHTEYNKHTPSNSVSISESVIHKNSTSVAVQQKAPKVLRRVVSKEKAIVIEKIYLRILLVILLILVVAVFQIPTVLYYTDPPSTNDFQLDGVNLESCTVTNVEMFQPSNVSLLDKCNLCKESELCYNCTDDIAEEFYLLQLVYDFSVVTRNSQCSKAIRSLFCNAVTSYDDDDITTPLDEECVKVRDNECAAEWRLMETFFNVTLLDCNSLNDSGHILLSKAPAQNCPDDFGVLCGSVCQPLCAEISLFNDAATTAYEVLNIIFHSMSVVSGFGTLVACIYDRKKMFTYPLIYVVYNTVTFQIISLFLLLPYIFGVNDLLCSHPNLIVANSRPTEFCQLQGLVVQTGALIFFGFWLFHLCHLFHSLLYPFRAQLLMKSVHFKRYAHMIEIVIVLGCGFIPSIVIVSTSGYGYSGFPPSCNSENPAVLFYTLILPIALGSTVGLCVLLFSLWTLRMNKIVQNVALRQRPSMRDIVFTHYSTPETKLIILFSYYCITVILLLIHLVVNLRSIDPANENLINFTLCSAGGNREECDDFRETLHRSLIPSIVFDVISTSFIAFANIINLLYVLQYKDVKKAVNKLFSSSST